MNKFIILLLMMVQQTPSLGSIQFSKNIVGKTDKLFSGAERGRTVDLRLAKPALSQLSYSPRRLLETRWAKEDLNFRPHAYQACALTN